ncbi:hypothetical protein ABZ234_31855 [Nocardiopsis sp. NPDC006198]|uniref:hypothetical protein n=1 Tax=Nocardiopsis sp. NPDC006198 TaxID=3154472 RepID=UPI00339EBE3F
MFERTLFYRIRCDAPGCIRTATDYDTAEPLLVASPDLDAVREELTDEEGRPWGIGPGGQTWCPGHRHLLRVQQQTATAYEPQTA